MKTFLDLVDDGDFDEIFRRIEINDTEGINDLDDYGRTPLSIAVLYSNLSLIEKLCDAGADVNLFEPKLGGDPPIMYAIDSNNDEIINALIQRGANLDVHGWMGISPRQKLLASSDKP